MLFDRKSKMIVLDAMDSLTGESTGDVVLVDPRIPFATHPVKHGTGIIFYGDATGLLMSAFVTQSARAILAAKVEAEGVLADGEADESADQPQVKVDSKLGIRLAWQSLTGTARLNVGAAIKDLGCQERGSWPECVESYSDGEGVCHLIPVESEDHPEGWLVLLVGAYPTIFGSRQEAVDKLAKFRRRA